MGWTELRSSAVIGTGRRTQIPDAVDGHAISDAAFPSTEERALAAAALLGTQRRAGVTVRPATSRPADASPPEETPEAPGPAIQLLDLALAGNLGRPAESNALVAHWLRTATTRSVVVPHRLLVPLLTRATSSPELQGPARGPLGERGRWLAGQRTDWSWATTTIGGGGGLAGLEERLVTTTGAERRDALTGIRTIDPTRGRELLAASWSQERASERAVLLGCLVTGLSGDDDPFLDAALDDKAKSVREAAAAVLDRLPTSARADRLRAVLRPLISVGGGLLRKRLVLAPIPDEVDLSRDLPGTTPTNQRRDLVRATPLAVWMSATGSTAEKLLSLPRDPEDLARWWIDAAVVQQDEPWMRVLALASGSVAVLRGIAGPWSADDSRRFLEAIRRAKTPNLSVTHGADLLIERLHPSAVPDLEAWRQGLGEDGRQVDGRLRQIIQLVSTRSSITEAFS